MESRWVHFRPRCEHILCWWYIVVLISSLMSSRFRVGITSAFLSNGDACGVPSCSLR